MGASLLALAKSIYYCFQERATIVRKTKVAITDA